MFKYLLPFFALVGSSLFGAAPDCVVSFSLAGAGTSAVLSNRQSGCTEWTATYNAQGFAAVTVTVQSAPDAGATPGAWVSFAGTVNVGTNPLVATDQAYVTLTGYNPWLRVNVAVGAGAGTVVGSLYGYREAQSGGGAVPNPIQVEGCTAAGIPPTCPPVLVGGIDGAGNGQIVLTDTAGRIEPAYLVTTIGDNQHTGNAIPQPADAAVALHPNNFPSIYNGTTGWDRQFVCSLQAPIVVTASGNTQIVGLVAAKVIRICHVSMSGDAAVNVKFTTGTGANCGTGTADLTGLYYNSSSLALDFGAVSSLRSPSAQAICVNLSGAANWGGVVMYAQY